VEVGAEDGDVVVGGAEGFEAFVALLAVVEPWAEPVDCDVGVGYKLRGRPLSR
jgi:hypothetical protein